MGQTFSLERKDYAPPDTFRGFTLKRIQTKIKRAFTESETISKQMFPDGI